MPTFCIYQSKQALAVMRSLDRPDNTSWNNKMFALPKGILVLKVNKKQIIKQLTELEIFSILWRRSYVVFSTCTAEILLTWEFQMLCTFQTNRWMKEQQTYLIGKNVNFFLRHWTQDRPPARLWKEINVSGSFCLCPKRNRFSTCKHVTNWKY